jgi:hypothetical protein
LLELSQNAIHFTSILEATVASGVVLDSGVDFTADAVTVDSVLDKTDTAVGVFFTSGTPEGSLTAGIGSLASRRDGGAGTTLYIKESGTGNTGWAVVEAASTNFLALSDTPGSYQGDYWVKVNAGGSALEFVTQPDWMLEPATPARGEVLYYDGADWTNLGVGTSGQVLTTQGAAADPTWSDVPASGIAAPSTPAWGELLYYDGLAWENLGVGTSGQLLQTNGAAADPTWVDPPDTMPSGVQGNILYHNGADWAVLAPGTDGYVLTTHGAAANPTWTAASGGACTFEALTDTPTSPAMASAGSTFVKVNSGGTALEYVAANYIVEPGEQSHGTILMVDATGDYASFAPGTEGKVLTSHGTAALTWETPSSGSTTFEALTDTPASPAMASAGGDFVAVNSGGTALEYVAAPSGGGAKAYTVAEYDTGDTYGGVPIYAVIVDFGAGPNATTKSVASGLGVNDVYQLVDMTVIGNDLDEGWVAQEDSANKASFTYNKLDYKVYCTTTADLSGVTYEVLLKYIKEPRTMSGSFPHIIATVSGGSWGSLSAGVHVLSADGYAFTYGGTYSSPTVVNFTWQWSEASPMYKIRMDKGRTFSGAVASTVLFSSYTGTSTQSTQSSWASTSGAVTTPYSKAVGMGDRAFKAYTVGGKTITFTRASDFPLKPATYST